MKRLEKALDQFKNKKILVVGDVMLDIFNWGIIERINPEQPASPLTKILSREYLPGGAANVANNVSSLGADTTLWGVIGKDYFGEELKKICIKKRIYFHPTQINFPTIVKERTIAHGQQIARNDYGEENLEASQINFSELMKQGIPISFENLIKEKGKDGIVLSDYNKIVFNPIFTKDLIKYAKELNIPIFTDPKPQNIHYFKGCDLICPNRKEAEEMTGIHYIKENGTLAKMGKSLSEKLGSDVIITLSEDGIFSYEKSGNYQHVPTYARKVAEVTGAGDTFISTLALGRVSGLNLHDAAVLANVAAGIAVEKPGTATPSIEEIRARLPKE